MKKHITKIIALIIAVGMVVYVGATIPKENPKEKFGSDYYVKIAETKAWEVKSDFKPIECELDKDVQKFAYYIAEANDIDFNFLMAVMYCESGFDANCISATNDYGLMQINQLNHEFLSNTLGINDFLDPYQNIIAGTYVFTNLFEKYGSTSKVLMAYNMGENGASVLWNQGINTSKYSEKVMQKMNEMGAMQ